MDTEALEKLNNLKNKGAISEEEFNAAKKEILTSSSMENKSKNINSNYVWALAFAPLIGLFLEGFIAGATGTPFEDLWFITLGLNIFLSYLDARQLKNHRYEGAMLDNAWFIPGYLYERSKLLKEPPIYLWSWLVTFFFVILV